MVFVLIKDWDCKNDGKMYQQLFSNELTPVWTHKSSRYGLKGCLTHVLEKHDISTRVISSKALKTLRHRPLSAFRVSNLAIDRPCNTWRETCPLR